MRTFLPVFATTARACPGKTRKITPSLKLRLLTDSDNAEESLSVMDAVIDDMVIPLSLPSELVAEWEMVELCAPSAAESSVAVTVTVCAVFQFAVVKVREPKEPTCASVPKATVTLAVGCVFKKTVYVSVAPPSVMSVDPPEAEIVIPAVSLSVMEAVTEAIVMPL